MPFKTELQYKIKPGDDLIIVLTAPLIYADKLGRIFTIPTEFPCDLASIPKIFRSLATDWWVTASPGVLHDAGYRWYELWKISRKHMDELYQEALRDKGVSRWRAWTQKQALRIGGRGAWNRWRDTPETKKGIPPGKVSWVQR
jgi:hypothetical protein